MEPDEESTEAPIPFDLDQTPVDMEPGSETRFFSRTAALHQRLFDYDELAWLGEQVEAYGLREALLGSRLQPGRSVTGWAGDLPSAEPLWLALRLGVVAPKTHRAQLDHPSAEELAAASQLTKRGERLIAGLQGQKVHWNEMAALRYKVRQGRVFKPLRAAARAYRPGGGLAELSAARLAYELEWIYAHELGKETIAEELRRLLCLGFLSPKPRARGDAWYPAAWDQDPPVEISVRGIAMLEGFRLEDDE
jgi:hypothetical protein